MFTPSGMLMCYKDGIGKHLCVIGPFAGNPINVSNYHSEEAQKRFINNNFHLFAKARGWEIMSNIHIKIGSDPRIYNQISVFTPGYICDEISSIMKKLKST